MIIESQPDPVAGRPDETGGVELEPGDEDDVGVADVSAQLAISIRFGPPRQSVGPAGGANRKTGSPEARAFSASRTTPTTAYHVRLVTTSAGI